MSYSEPPQNFADQVQQVLRSWNEGPPDPVPLRSLWLAQEQLGGNLRPTPVEIWAVARNMVDSEMTVLSEQGLEQFIWILAQRYKKGFTAREVANALDVGADRVFQRQRETIQQLAQAIWERELALRGSQRQHNAERLPDLGARQLFGIGARRAELKSLLEQAGAPHLLVLEGIGGIGKTTLANAVARDLLSSDRYRRYVWISARQEEFSAGEGLRSKDGPALTENDLLEEIIEQLALDSLRHQPQKRKLSNLKRVLNQQPYLVIVDNLETVADVKALEPYLQMLATGASKFLLTSRRSLRQHAGVFSASLDELAEPDALALLRFEARGQNLLALAGASDDTLRPIYEVIGGNPLALRLVIGQATILPLDRVIENLSGARGRKAYELYRYIYERAWQQLDNHARHLLVRMPVFSQTGATLERIEAINDISADQLTDALDQLITLSLVNISGDYQSRRYSIHRLTETFIRREIFGMTDDEDDGP